MCAGPKGSLWGESLISWPFESIFIWNILQNVPKVSCEQVPRDVCQTVIQCPVCSEPQYVAPVPVYEAPVRAPAYDAPEPVVYEAPVTAPAYAAPEPVVYEAPVPAPAYAAPEPVVYEAPAPVNVADNTPNYLRPSYLASSYFD